MPMSSAASVCSLARVASYRVPSRNFNLVISRGSVVEWSHNTQSSAIVNAANEGCLGGGGVDGAIGDAGGDMLFEDRMNLPQQQPGVRCQTGSAVMTGPNSYGSLNVPYVIHAVGPDYMQYDTEEEMAQGDELLSSAYTTSLECGKSKNIEAIAFALLSAGIFRGKRSVDEVLQIGIDAICKFDGYPSLQEVHLCAFNQKEANALIRIATALGLSEGEQ
mmetsp:Transcript_22974/g.35249  ORF Transcript_22974/g.35249 Transcript_22974/m.35249 type:complete len:219 (+) Transcript_22974:47-703(+)